MTSNLRAARRREARLKPLRRPTSVDPDASYQMTIGWCATDDLRPTARQETHDLLIDQMGDARTGPVGWIENTGEDAFEALERLFMWDPTEEERLGYRRLRAHLREWGGWLIIAIAPCHPDNRSMGATLLATTTEEP